MKDCVPEPKLASFLPDFARNQHGNLAEQNRSVGAQHGADTTKPPPTSLAAAKLVVASAAAAPAPKSTPPSAAAAAIALMQKNGCTACHGVDNKVLGPAFRDVAKKYGDRKDAVAYLAGKIRAGSAGVWGSIPMPAQTVSEADAKTLAQWLAAGAPK
jgi:cytochrome c